MVILILALAVLATIYMLRNLYRYNDSKEIGLKIEQALGLFEKGKFIEGDSLFPSKRTDEEPKSTGSYLFIIYIWLFALAASVAILFSQDNLSEPCILQGPISGNCNLDMTLKDFFHLL